MNFGSLFSGIDGFGLGLEWAGMTCAWQVEWDEYCLKVLNKHWPDIQKFGDVKNVGRHNLEPVDLIAGGFPCQPHSVAGKRRGAEDDRNLWPEFSRVIAELKPRYVLAENVPGIITTYLDTVLSDLESQDYTCATFNIPACAFDAPHRRERIFIVAYSTSTDARRDNREEGEGTGLDLEQDSLDQGRRDKSQHITDSYSSYVTDTSPMQRSSIKRDEQDGILSKILADTENANRRRTGGAEYSGRRHSQIGRCSIGGNRETYWTVEPDVGRVAHGVPSRVDRLRVLGNAVVPQVAEWIGKRIIEFDERHNS